MVEKEVHFFSWNVPLFSRDHTLGMWKQKLQKYSKIGNKILTFHNIYERHQGYYGRRGSKLILHSIHA